MVFAFAFTAVLVLTGLATSACVGLRRQRRYSAAPSTGSAAELSASAGAEAGETSAGAAPALPREDAVEADAVEAAGTAA